MSDLTPKFKVGRKEVVKNKTLKFGAWALPFILAFLPSIIFLVLFILFGTTTSIVASFLFLSIISAFIGFILGLFGSVGLLLYRSRWLAGIREMIAADGIKAEEIDWFTNELRHEERKALREIQAQNLLLADAYRETLASRLTAARIIKSSKHELLLARRRKNKFKYLNSDRVGDFKREIDGDINRLTGIQNEAEEMKIEAEARLQMIEAASRRGNKLMGNELALKKLSARSRHLPLALEEAKMEEKFRKEIERGLEKELKGRYK